MKKKQVVIIVVVVVLLLGLKIFLKPPTIIVSGISPLICSGANYFFTTDKPLIALTIDDTPDDNHIFPHTTLGILDVLANYNAKATFFVITEKAQKFPALIESIVEQGHELGNHLTTDESSLKLGDEFETEFVAADRFLSQFAPVHWLRPGHGFCNAEIIEIAKKYSYKIALGSVWSYDTNKIVSPQFSSWYIKRNIRSGSIIILHDSNQKSDRRGKNTIEILERIIPQLQQQGYQFVTLSELDRESKD